MPELLIFIIIRKLFNVYSEDVSFFCYCFALNACQLSFAVMSMFKNVIVSEGQVTHRCIIIGLWISRCFLFHLPYESFALDGSLVHFLKKLVE